MKPPIAAYRRAIRPTQVFTWHNSSLIVLRRASMRTSCAMMASRVTSPAEDEGAEVDGAIEVEGVIVSIRGHLSQSCALLYLMAATSIALKMRRLDMRQKNGEEAS